MLELYSLIYSKAHPIRTSRTLQRSVLLRGIVFCLPGTFCHSPALRRLYDEKLSQDASKTLSSYRISKIL